MASRLSCDLVRWTPDQNTYRPIDGCPTIDAIESRRSRTCCSLTAELVAGFGHRETEIKRWRNGCGAVSMTLTAWTSAWCRAASAWAMRVAACAAGDPSVANSTTPRLLSSSANDEGALPVLDAALVSSCIACVVKGSPLRRC